MTRTGSSALVLAAAAAIASAQVVGRCKLGTKGPNVSCIAYGTLHLHEAGSSAAALAIIEANVALGITTFDLSDVYNSEPQLFGAALQLSPGLRDRIEIIAKMDIVPALGGFGFDSSSAYDSSCGHLNAVLATYLSSLATTYGAAGIIDRWTGCPPAVSRGLIRSLIFPKISN